jgi:hypothetical protein
MVLPALRTSICGALSVSAARGSANLSLLAAAYEWYSEGAPLKQKENQGLV